MNDYETRFGGIARLYGKKGLEQLRSAHVCIIGVGGVGSWIVEALTRTGIGALTLIDLDDVCVSNVNRQLPALDGEIGKPKVEVIARRMLAINPSIQITNRLEFLTKANAGGILGHRFSYVIDAIDGVTNKCEIISKCRAQQQPVLAIGSAGGKRDPTRLRIADLAQTTHDPLLQQVRKKLRQYYDFPTDPKQPFGVACVYSPEAPVFPHKDGTICDVKEEGSDLKLTCEGGYGSATFVTGAFAFAASSYVVKALTTDNTDSTDRNKV